MMHLKQLGSSCALWLGVAVGVLSACMDEMRSLPERTEGALNPDPAQAAPNTEAASETETASETEAANAEVRASAGCGASGRPEGGLVTLDAEYIYRFPESYDGSTPLPLVFAFHANANPNTQFLDATQGTPLAGNFVMAFPKSVGMGWAVDVDAPRLDGVYAELLANYCIDENRVFALGHSSGAQFIEQLLCRGETRFRAVAPSAGAATCASWSPIPTLFIHGQNDTERLNSGDADGAKDLAGYVTSNSCQPSTQSYDVAGCLRDGAPVNPGCVSYEGCSAPMVQCSHDDPNYGGTNHGWPCFATQAVFDFFTSQL
ncbi:MAG TPA: hypothetical protein VJU61_26765 [Polyangiaceae bacterium]|nr:hypothetical protein [Polyangiaceae bacterium]